jgi:Fe-S-cluster formation regulator IscX/YfhJ
MKAFGILGLVILLFVILLLGPYVQRFTEGFQDQVPTMTPKEIEEKVKNLGQQIVQLNTFMEDPTLDSSTKEKIVKQKEELQKEVEKISGAPLPSAEVQPPKKEGFTGAPSAMMEKQGKGLVETAAQTL